MSNNPIAVSVREAAHMTSLGRTKIYQLLASQQLDAVKIGRRTLVTAESLRRLIEEAR